MRAPANLLSWLVWLPIAAGLVVLLLGDRRIAIVRWVALAATLAALALCVPLWCGFDTTTAALQYVEREPWIGAINAWYHLGVDGISMPLVVLLAPDFAIVERWRDEPERALRRQRAPRAMSPTALRRFLMHYERLSRRALKTLPQLADIVIELDARRRVRRVKTRR